MATKTLTNPQTWPSGTSVEAYLSDDLSHPPSGAPNATAVDTQVADANGSVTFAGLADDTDYFAYALVGGEHRYIQFRSDPAPGGSSFAHLAEDTDLERLTADWQVVVGDVLADSLVLDPAGTLRVNGDGGTTQGRYRSRSFLHYLAAGSPNPATNVYELWPDEGNGDYPTFGWTQAGVVYFGDGVAAPDARIERSAAKTLNLTNGTNDLILKVNGVAVTVP